MNTRICPECGAEFRPLHGSQVCCSDECKRNRLRMQRRESKRCNARIRKLSPHQRMLANLRRRDLLAPKPKIEIIDQLGEKYDAASADFLESLKNEDGGFLDRMRVIHDETVKICNTASDLLMHRLTSPYLTDQPTTIFVTVAFGRTRMLPLFHVLMSK